MDRLLKRLIHEVQLAEKEATDYKALNMIKRKPGITKDPHIETLYNLIGKQRKVAQRVFELLDVYRLDEKECYCLLECLKYHSNWLNLHPIKLKES